MNARKALFTSKLALTLVLAYVIIRAVLPPGAIDTGPVSASALGKNGAQAIEMMCLPALSVEDYAQIVKRNPFGASDQAAGSSRWSLTADSFRFDRSTSEELGLALFGTVSGSPSVARAIIKDLKTGVFGLYKVGQVVRNARVESVEADAVILLHNGERKVLKITAWQSNSSNNDYVSPPQTNKGRIKTLEADSLGEESGAKIRTGIEYVEEVLKQAAIEPYIVNGQIEGLRITGLENLMEENNLGLRNGDIIRSANGHLLTSKQKAFQVFKKARSQKTITIELLRGNRLGKLSFAL